jgi:hypothetical protein
VTYSGEEVSPISALQPIERLAGKRRSRVSLLLQLVLQWIYLPLWGVFAAALGLLAAAASAGLNPPVAWFNPGRGLLTWQRFRTEWAWDPVRWDAYAAERIRKKAAAAVAGPTSHSRKLPDGGRELSTTVSARCFRGVGPERAVAIAEADGWGTELKADGREEWNPGALRIFRPLVGTDAEAVG